MPIAIAYPAFTYLIDDNRLTPASSRPCTVTSGGVTSRPVVIADTPEKARCLDAALGAAVTRAGIGDTYFNPAAWLSDDDITAAAVTAGCHVIG